MKTHVKIVVGIILLGAIGFFLYFFLISPGKSNKVFYRLGLKEIQEHQDKKYFRVDNKKRRLYFKKGKKEIRLEGVPSINGYYFYLSGKKQIKISPPLNGNIRLYSYLYIKSLSQSNGIDFSVIIKRGEAEQQIKRIVCAKASQPTYTDLEVGKKDVLLFRFEGRGIIYMSPPIFYHVPRGKGQNLGKKIFFIAVDTLRGDQIGKKVNGKSITPTMDKFIKDSVYFENANAQTSWTLPSFMSIFTGLYEFNHGVRVNKALDMQKPYLIESLSRDFITFGIHGGKVMNRRWGFSRGFDYYKKFQPAAALYPKGGQSLFRKAIEVIEQSMFPNLFLFLHTYQVHAPYTPPKNFLNQLNPNPKYFKLDPINYSEPEKTYVPAPDDEKIALKELYQAEILAFDTFFGEFIGELKKRNLYNDAMIVLISDHGEEFFEHKGWAHSHSLYDELIRVPLFIKFPKNQFKNIRIKKEMGMIDLFPTILSYYQIPCHVEKIDGINLMPLIETNRISNSRDYIISSISIGRYFEAFPTRVAFRFDDYKLIYNDPYKSEDLEKFKTYFEPPELPRLELYSLKDDPGEEKNIIHLHPEIKKKMMPIILKVRKLINERSLQGKGKVIDEEVKKQLESLGYL